MLQEKLGQQDIFNSKDDPIADLHEDMAAEEKARATYGGSFE